MLTVELHICSSGHHYQAPNQRHNQDDEESDSQTSFWWRPCGRKHEHEHLTLLCVPTSFRTWCLVKQSPLTMKELSECSVRYWMSEGGGGAGGSVEVEVEWTWK